MAFFPWAAVAEISMSFGQLLYKFESMEKVLDEGKIISSSVDADGYVGVWLMYEGKLFYCQLHDVLDISKNWCRMNQKADN